MDYERHTEITEFIYERYPNVSKDIDAIVESLLDYPGYIGKDFSSHGPEELLEEALMLHFATDGDQTKLPFLFNHSQITHTKPKLESLDLALYDLFENFMAITKTDVIAIISQISLLGIEQDFGDIPSIPIDIDSIDFSKESEPKPVVQDITKYDAIAEYLGKQQGG